VADRFAARARRAGRTVEVEGGSPLVVTADPDRLDRAVVNLVDNALRHGAGTVRLASRRLPSGVEISVADEGADRAGAREAGVPREPGRGLGLSIVDALARAQGGSVALDSEATGTRVVLTLPRASTHA
jgi:signal transduction histidine kinase